MNDYRRYLPMTMDDISFREDPLSIVARTAPHEISSVVYSALAARRIEARTDLMRSVSSDHAAAICTWLQNRSAGERNMMIGTAGHSSERGLFPCGETFRMVTQVSIW